jgi:phage terminase small subunit
MHDEAEKDYKQGMKYDEIAKKYNVSINTVKSWKTRYKWSRTAYKKERIQKNKKCAVSVVDELSDQHKLFCIYFANTRNATQAYLKAFGCSYNAASVSGYRLLRTAKINDEIDQLIRERRSSLKITPDDIIERQMKIAFADMGDVAEWGTHEIPLIDNAGNMQIDDCGNIITVKRNYMNFKGSEQVDGSLICEVSYGKQGMKVKLEDRQKALAFLADYFNMNPNDTHKQVYDNAKLKQSQEEFAKKTD